MDRRLRRLHIARGDRRTFVDEVRSDLQTAAAEGVSPAALLGPDIDAFAREAIQAGGYRPQPHDYQRVLVGGGLAAAVAVVGAYFLIVELLTPALASVFELDGHYPTGGPVMASVAIALISLLGLLAALKRLLAGRPAVRETLIRVALLTPLGALAGIAGAVAVARAPDYTATEANAYMQVLFLVLPVLAALGVSRWWAVRTSTDRDDPASTSHVLS